MSWLFFLRLMMCYRFRRLRIDVWEDVLIFCYALALVLFDSLPSTTSAFPFSLLHSIGDTIQRNSHNLARWERMTMLQLSTMMMPILQQVIRKGKPTQVFLLLISMTMTLMLIWMTLTELLLQQEKRYKDNNGRLADVPVYKGKKCEGCYMHKTKKNSTRIIKMEIISMSIHT